MNQHIRDISEKLLRHYPERLVCKADTDLTIEGFPRSANTFCVDFFRHLYQRNNRVLQVAHHTHSPMNVELAIQLQIPCLVLIREPVAALTSFAIYTEKEVSKIAKRYTEFYESIESWNDHILVADFDLVVGNFNGVINKLNYRYNLALPLSENVTLDKPLVKQLDIDRARKQRSHEEFVRTVGAPIDERENLKARLKPKVLEYFRKNDNILKRYETIKKLSSYIKY